MISNCGKDERGAYSGGVAGDQTGSEYAVINWYNRPWNCVLRHPDAKVRTEIAKLARSAANNSNIGYDQYERLSMWTQLTKCGYDPAAIKTPCEADCSSSTAAIVKAVGFRLNIAALQMVQHTLTTHNMRSAFRIAGFEVLTDSKYLTSSAYLAAGDILLNDSAHVAINLDDGPYADASSTQYTYQGGGQTTPTLRKGMRGAYVKKMQEKLIEAGEDLGVDGADGDFGEQTLKAVLSFQKKNNLVQDGVVGPKTWEALEKTKPGQKQDVKQEAAAADTVVNEEKPSRTYIVKEGDSLWGIAKKELGNPFKYLAIKKLNGLKSDAIYIGQELKLPE